MNINVTLGDDSTIYCNVQLITPIVNIEMTGIKGETGSIPGAGIPVSSGAAWDTSLTATVESTFILSGPSPFAWAKKTLLEVKAILGLIPQAVGFTLSGGTTSKTLTVSESMTLKGYASASEITIGLEADKAISPGRLRDSEAAAAEIVTGTAKKLITADQAHTSLMKVSGSNLAIGSDANGDMYYRASNVLARLAKGTANFKQFMNAAGTAPEWANGIKLGSFTRDAAAEAGDVSYDGVGFKPTILVFFSDFSATSQSDGISDVTNNYCLLRLSAPALSYSGTRCIYIANSAGTAHQDAVVKSMDSDGFTLTWAKTFTPTGTASIFYIAFR